MSSGMFGITQLSMAKTRSITAENVYGEKGRGGMAELSATPQPEVVKIGQKWEGPNPCAQDLGQTWKVRPCISLDKQTTTTLMDVGIRKNMKCPKFVPEIARLNEVCIL